MSRKSITIAPKKIFLFTLGLGAAGGAAYLAREYYLNRKSAPGLPVPAGPDTSSSGGSIFKDIFRLGDSFPLKKGSKGPRVEELQTALAQRLGMETMNRYGGIDGDFGSGTESALRQAGFPLVIDQALFNRITGRNNPALLPGTPSVSLNASQLATALYNHAMLQNIGSVITDLKQMKSTADYSAVNEKYKKLGLISRTIVTGLLDFSFDHDPAAKERIRKEFLRMGLKHDTASGRWSLDGLPMFRDLVTLYDTWVQDRSGLKLMVKKGTILGEEIGRANGLSWFRALNQSVAAVPIRHVQYV